jgi:peptidoglycan-associated lipoprotein
MRVFDGQVFLLSFVRLASVMFLAVAACTSTPDYPNCENDQHCQRDNRREWCVQRHCQQCRTTEDCGADTTCLRNRCVPGVNACDGDNDCLVGQMCEAHRCTRRPECDSVRPCTGGQRCDAGRCVADNNDTDPVENRGTQCTFEPPVFEFDDVTLSESARQSLQRAAECIQRERTTRYVLMGRCDARGDSTYNLALGERRARIVYRYLVSLGVLPDRLGVSSEGSEFAEGRDETGWRRDRRVDFRLRPL